MTLIEIVKNKISQFESQKHTNQAIIKKAKLLYIEGLCQMISRGKFRFEFIINVQNRNLEFSIAINSETNDINALQNDMEYSWDEYVIACLYQLLAELNWSSEKLDGKGMKYTRDGMIKRVLNERKQKAISAEYEVQLAENIYGEHTVINERGISYKITLRDFEHETGYIDSIDLRTNKLGTTKHIMWLFEKLKQEPELMNGLETKYPFVEVFLDPQNEYKITWFYPHPLDNDVQTLVQQYFDTAKVYPDTKTTQFLDFIEAATQYPIIKIRDEVIEKVERAFEIQLLEKLQQTTTIDFSVFRLALYPYQQEGVKFATFRKGAIIADEFGLGKTIQAIASAIIKKQVFGFRKIIIACPAAIVERWSFEIQKFTTETFTIAKGDSKQRKLLYNNDSHFFVIASYETIVADSTYLAQCNIDLLILDETQKIKNYQSKTSTCIQSIPRKHTLVLTDSPIEDKLIDLYSIVAFVDQYFISPLWEFSYQYCLFDSQKTDSITGYYNLSDLKKKMDSIMIRRDKQSVIKQLPNITEVNIPVRMHPIQLQHYTRITANLKQLLLKKILSPFDIKKIMLQLTNLRMVCNSTYLIDKETTISPKLAELKHLLVERIHITQQVKIVIFTEWEQMNNLIAAMLHQEGIAFAEIYSGMTAQLKKRIIEKFNGDNCSILLATDADVKNIDLQKINYIINFEIPWDTDKRINRMGHINKLIQQSIQCTTINFITEQSIETNIANGQLQKYSDFSQIFNDYSSVDYIDAEQPGIAQTINNIALLLNSEHSTDEYSMAVSDVFLLSNYQYDELNLHEGAKNAELTPDLKPEMIVEQTHNREIIDCCLNNMYSFYNTSTKKSFEYSNHLIEYDVTTDNYIIRLSKSKDLFA